MAGQITFFIFYSSLTLFFKLQNHSQELLFSMTIGLSNFIDTPATLDEHPINQIIRDAVQLQTIGEPKDILKLYIGIAGIQHSGVSISPSLSCP